MTKEIKSSTTWERRGNLKKKSQETNVFKDRHFKLERDFLVYYKQDTKDGGSDNISVIHLGSAHLRMIQSPEVMKYEKENKKGSKGSKE